MVVLNTGERLKYLRRLKPALVARVCAARNCLPESVDIEVPMPPRRKKQPAPIAEDPAPPAVEEEVPSIEEKTEWEPEADRTESVNTNAGTGTFSS